jgi:hypothetical protein
MQKNVSIDSSDAEERITIEPPYNQSNLTSEISLLKSYFSLLTSQPIPIEPLAFFRIMFGLMMLISTVRFMALGWIDYQYIDSIFHFKYYGFEWVQAMGRISMYALYLLMIVASLFIMLGLYYRIAALFFFLAFTYCELIDKTYYLNHYYFVSIVSLLMVFLPAEKKYSLDVSWRKIASFYYVPAWTINLVKFQLGIVYFFAGIAKLNHSWLIDAMPLKIWLPAQSHLPIIGGLFEISWMPNAFSWAGALFDLTIPFILLSRFWYLGFIAVIGFHALTSIFFQIGMFPVVMICSVPIFFPVAVHQKIFGFFRFSPQTTDRRPQQEIQNPNHKSDIINHKCYCYPKLILKPLVFVLVIHVVFQIVFPWRYVLYPGNMFWTEEGYRFGWRVMLMEKAGYATFYVKDGDNGKEGIVINSEFLNEHQEKQMAMQPDMILEFAHFLGKHYKSQGINDPQVRVEAYATLNGSRSKLLVNPEVNLLAYRESMKPKTWLMPFEK